MAGHSSMRQSRGVSLSLGVIMIFQSSMSCYFAADNRGEGGIVACWRASRLQRKERERGVTRFW